LWKKREGGWGRSKGNFKTGKPSSNTFNVGAPTLLGEL
jgi:hypothetical protein